MRTEQARCDCWRRFIDSQALTFVLLNPALGGGARTLNRVAKLASHSRAENYRVVNLFETPTASTSELARLGEDELAWQGARAAILDSIRCSKSAILAYGVAAPPGAVMPVFNRQVDWLGTVLGENDVLAWQVGGAPRHPSRWQRYTSRFYSDLTFDQALVLSVHRSDRRCWGDDADAADNAPPDVAAVDK